MLTLDYVQDYGHGWIAADRADLQRLGLLRTISEYSYDGEGRIWLEEDCDAPRYLRALSAAGIQYTLRETHIRGDAWIRRLPRFEA